MQIQSNEQEILNKVWDEGNHILLISTLNKVEVLTDYVDLTQLIKLLHTNDVELDYSFGGYPGHVLKITSSSRVYGVTRSRKGFYKGRTLYFLGDIFTYDAPDDIQLAEYITASAALLRLLPDERVRTS